jgi:putative DNA primase/helicase
VGSAFADQLAKATRANYGHAIHLFLTRLVEDQKKWAEKYTQKVNNILKMFSRDLAATDGEALRVAETFAILAAAGAVATEMGITAWGEGDAVKGVQCCFNDWLKNHGTGSSDDTSFVAFVNETLQRFGTSRFEKYEGADTFIPGRYGWEGVTDHHESKPKTEPFVTNRLGYRWDEVGGIVYFFLPDAFRRLCVEEGHNIKSGVEALDKLGMLARKDKGRLQLTKRVSGVHIKGYLIRQLGVDEQIDLAA